MNRSDDLARVDWRHWALWACVPVHLLIASAIALYLVETPWRQDRHRFGPDATWRLELRRQEAQSARLTKLARPVNLTSPEDVAARRPVLIAHRGGVITSATPECSLGAIRLAKAHGYSLVELDIQESRDHVPMVFHDRTLERACARTGAIADLDAATLQSVLYKGTVQRLATLEQALELCSELGLGVMLDVKTKDGSARFFKTIVELIDASGLRDATLTISRAPSIRRHLPGILRPIDEERLATAEVGSDPAASLDGGFWFGLPENLPDDKVARLKALGVFVFPAINTFRYPAERHAERAREDIRRLRAAGVDGFQIDSVYQGEFGIEPQAAGR